ncbi:CLUMA_CG010393, isoform A [Clunio marinus]|uniref:CLUMA_CG010393, isoform A n=1 Tax=Clunio marinus TaxID=568069 RepID=A0A1J1IDD5_9DIPT|nr:CLUMA_CG010393, isoform A [Clunio marinus]
MYSNEIKIKLLMSSSSQIVPYRSLYRISLRKRKRHKFSFTLEMKAASKDGFYLKFFVISIVWLYIWRISNNKATLEKSFHLNIHGKMFLNRESIVIVSGKAFVPGVIVRDVKFVLEVMKVKEFFVFFKGFNSAYVMFMCFQKELKCTWKTPKGEDFKSFQA